MNSETPTMAVQQVQPVEQQSMLVLIDRAARDPSVDVAKMERLLAMAEKVHERTAKSLYDQAMNAAQAEMRPISRDCHNPQTRSKYASYEAIDTAIRPIYTNHGFSMSFGSKASTIADRVIVTCRVSHRGGHTENVELEMPADGKGARGNDVMTKTHATGSALSYAKRYITNLVWNLSFGEADDDGNAAGRKAAPRREPTHPVKTPQNPQVEPKRATPEDLLPKKATESRRKGVLDFLRQSFSDSELLAFARDKAFVEPGEHPLESWDLSNIPATNQQLNELAAEIGQWLEGSEAPEDKPELEDYNPEWFWNQIITVPRAGTTRDEYLKKPDTIRSLYDAMKQGDAAAQDRLWGMVESWEPTPWRGRPPSGADMMCRRALDAFREFEKAKNQPSDDVPTP